ncbi:unnamed protein product, partial [Symbiodinium sp. CCMP2592]
MDLHLTTAAELREEIRRNGAAGGLIRIQMVRRGQFHPGKMCSGFLSYETDHQADFAASRANARAMHPDAAAEVLQPKAKVVAPPPK